MLWANDAEGYTGWSALLHTIPQNSILLCFVLLIILSLPFINADNLPR
jgi:hypothetical protein